MRVWLRRPKPSFRAVDKELADHEPGPAKVVSDRRIELLLKKASILHLSAANYCWFEDPAKATVTGWIVTPSRPSGPAARYLLRSFFRFPLGGCGELGSQMLERLA
ncbi:hypothetical protein [Streptomyces griseoluteus]|uniref:hypothetical protein n=1 Tax=Streptomyces griseoluteus TaxID=29306 RepID=UPI0036FC6D83